MPMLKDFFQPFAAYRTELPSKKELEEKIRTLREARERIEARKLLEEK
jgi:hypothetical protein